jgi:hypothetical protein
MNKIITSALLGALIQTSSAFGQGIPGDGTSLVQGWYAQFLHRAPDPGAAIWIQALQSGQQPESVLSQILGSGEYFVNAGNTNEGFINAIYRDVLSRPPTPGEMAYWLPRLAYTPRPDMVYALVTYTPQAWQTPSPGYYDRDAWRYNRDHRYHYRRPAYPYWR